MVIRFVYFLILFLAISTYANNGAIRGSVFDGDFDNPLSGVKIIISETGDEFKSSENGSFYMDNLSPGSYTLVFSFSGYNRFIKSNIVISEAVLTDLDIVKLYAEYEEMDELVVRDFQIGGSSEIGLLNLRMESSALMDAIGADLISRAGASDAAGALKLVSGTTVQDGKYAVVRGLPDRYVVSLLNGVRLPTADPDKRAVQLDQYPSSLIESVRVVKSFTPDQQGDASGGAVDVVLKTIPKEPTLNFNFGVKVNDNDGQRDFLSYESSKNNYLGQRDFNPPMDHQFGTEPIPQEITGSVGVKRTDHPVNYKWGLELGNIYDIPLYGEDVSLGVFSTINYEQSAKHTDDLSSDKYTSSPTQIQRANAQGKNILVPLISNWNLDGSGTALTELWDIKKSSHEINWNGAVGVGLEHELFKLNYLHVFTHNTEDSAIYAEDTRGRELYNPNYLNSVNPNDDASKYRAPFRRNETLLYKERDTSSNQLTGEYILPLTELNIGNILTLNKATLDWNFSNNSSSLKEPNKLILEYLWHPGEEVLVDDPNYNGNYSGGFNNAFNPNNIWLSDYTLMNGQVLSPPELSSDFEDEWDWLLDIQDDSSWALPTHGWYQEDLNVSGSSPGVVVSNATAGSYVPNEAGDQLGNFAIVYKEVIEESDQQTFNYKWDFENWTTEEGFFKIGLFEDRVNRKYFQQSLSNTPDNGLLGSGSLPGFNGAWTDDSSALFANGSRFYDLDFNGTSETELSNTSVFASLGDISYDGEQYLEAYYYMTKIPISDFLFVHGGARHEKFDLKTFLDPDDVQSAKAVLMDRDASSALTPQGNGFAEDADYSRDDTLPAIGVDIKPFKNIFLRVNYSETVAKQQFKEVTPILQREYPGAPIFAGNPNLEASPVRNYDYRLDYTPYPGGLISFSHFKKDIKDPIEYFMTLVGPNIVTFPTNYESAQVDGYEFEIRQDIGRYFYNFKGVNIGGNVTVIDGNLNISNEIERDVMGMPENLYNLFCTYDMDINDIKLGIFYTYQGDMLKINKPELGNIPAVYSLPYGSLNLSISASLTDNLKVSFKANNLTDPKIQTVFREEGFKDATYTSYTKARSFSLGFNGTF